VVLVAVLGLGFVRAAVAGVGDAVLVVVGLRASVVVFEACLIFGRARALVVLVRNGVQIVVAIGAAVAVLVAVLVFRLGGALIGGALDAVAVAFLALGHVQHAEPGAAP